MISRPTILGSRPAISRLSARAIRSDRFFLRLVTDIASRFVLRAAPALIGPSITGLIGIPSRVQLLLVVGDDCADSRVAGDIRGGAQHVENSVHSEDQGDSLPGNSDCLKNDDKHDDPRAGNSGSADGSHDRGQNDRELRSDGECLGN